jgi:hypothetical protein
MIKFTLTLWVCSFLSSPSMCLPPLSYPQPYDSWYECSMAAHKESLKLMPQLGYKYINDNEIATRYVCEPEELI